MLSTAVPPVLLRSHPLYLKFGEKYGELIWAPDSTRAFLVCRLSSIGWGGGIHDTSRRSRHFVPLLQGHIRTSLSTNCHFQQHRYHMSSTAAALPLTSNAEFILKFLLWYKKHHNSYVSTNEKSERKVESDSYKNLL